MAEQDVPKSKRGILKHRSCHLIGQPSVMTQEDDEDMKKSQKWDEMNILATYHPAGKDYGMMKIDEPNTPYNRAASGEDGSSDDDLDTKLQASELGYRLAQVSETEAPRRTAIDECDSSSDEEELSPEERENRRQFEMRRKMHYNEGQFIRKARALLEEEEEDDNRAETSTTMVLWPRFNWMITLCSSLKICPAAPCCLDVHVHIDTNMIGQC
uniref:Protein phosphatase inhibitor 2 n=1 Tax=Eptatretus burgeri TaxID=7764 RepID=A0A8C4NK43_EPTBU